jgi:hypothetical protein
MRNLLPLFQPASDGCRSIQAVRNTSVALHQRLWRNPVLDILKMVLESLMVNCAHA